MLKIRKASMSDLKKYYTMMEIDFDRKELINELSLQKGLIDGTIEMFVFSDEQSKIDVGYAVAFAKNVYSYVLLKYFAIFPWYRYKGVGREAYDLVEKQYENKYGMIAEVPVFEDNDDAQIGKLMKFFKSVGYQEIPSNYNIGGAKVNLLCKGLKGSDQIAKVAHRIIPDFYTRLTPKQRSDIKPLD